jgi:hypothetical protein
MAALSWPTTSMKEHKPLGKRLARKRPPKMRAPRKKSVRRGGEEDGG